jgi:hypothetical protein
MLHTTSITQEAVAKQEHVFPFTLRYQKARDFSTTRVYVKIKRRTLLHGVGYY